MSYSSKPTGGVGAPQAHSSGSTTGVSKHGISAVDWMCTVCGCVNFARRMLCFQVSYLVLTRYGLSCAGSCPLYKLPSTGGLMWFSMY